MRERADTKVLPSTPVDRLRLYAVFGIFALGFLYVAGGLAFRQLIQSSDLKEQSDNQSRRIVLRPPARGRIYDRNGFVLVDNRARWSVKADLAALQKEFRSEYLRLLAAERARQAVQVDTERVMELARVNVLQGWLNKVWFVIDENQRKTVRKPAPGKASPLDPPGERKVNIEDLRKHLRERRALPFTLVADLAFPVANVPAGPDEGVKAVARFIEQFPVEGPIRLESDIIRTYPYGGMAAHVLGYVKDSEELPPNVEDIAEVRSESMQKLRQTGKTGAAGVELSFDHVLKGLSGWELWTKTSSGYNQTRLKYSEPVQGSNINLSLDLRIQRATEQALAEIKDSQGVPLPAAAVLLDVHTGEILALASQPNGVAPSIATRARSDSRSGASVQNSSAEVSSTTRLTCRSQRGPLGIGRGVDVTRPRELTTHVSERVLDRAGLAEWHHLQHGHAVAGNHQLLTRPLDFTEELEHTGFQGAFRYSDHSHDYDHKSRKCQQRSVRRARARGDVRHYLRARACATAVVEVRAANHPRVGS